MAGSATTGGVVFTDDGKLVVTAFLLEPSSSPERSAALTPASEGFPEGTKFGKVLAFDAPVLLEPDTAGGTKIASYRGFLLYCSTVEGHVLLNASFIFTGGVHATELPAGTRLQLQGSFETSTFAAGGNATLFVVGATGPLLGATGYADYELVPGVGAPGDLFFRLTLHIKLPAKKAHK